MAKYSEDTTKQRISRYVYQPPGEDRWAINIDDHIIQFGYTSEIEALREAVLLLRDSYVALIDAMKP